MKRSVRSTAQCRWIGGYDPTRGDNSGRITVAPPAAQITRGGRLTAGDNPFLWCTASSLDSPGGRVIRPCLAGYEPNFYAQFDVHSQARDEIRFYDGFLGKWPDIYNYAERKFKLEKTKGFPTEVGGIGPKGELYNFYVRTPQPHCERLAFFANIDGSQNYYSQIAGWFKPGGAQGGTPPLKQNNSLFRRVAGSNICMSLIKRKGEVVVTAIDQDLPKTTKTAADDGGFEISSQMADPGFRNAIGGAEVWGAWCPSILYRPGDAIPSTPGEAMSFQDYDDSFAIGDAHTYKTGEYDWRFLNAFIERRTWTGTGRNRVQQIRHKGPMYWDVNNRLADMPSGLGDVYSFIDGQVTSRAIAAGVPEETKFDAMIQCAVYAMRCSPLMADWLEDRGWIVNRLAAKVNPKYPNDPAYSIRVWSHTNIRVKIRQAMPVPNLS